MAIYFSLRAFTRPDTTDNFLHHHYSAGVPADFSNRAHGLLLILIGSAMCVVFCTWPRLSSTVQDNSHHAA